MGTIGSMFIAVGVKNDLSGGLSRAEGDVKASAKRMRKDLDDAGRIAGGSGGGRGPSGGGGVARQLGGAGTAALAAGANLVGLGNTANGALSGAMAGGPAGAAVGAAVGLVKDGVDALAGAWHKVREEMSGIAALGREAEGLGISAADLRGMQQAAGAGADALGTGLLHFENALGAAADGVESERAKFRALGLDVDELSKMSPDKAFGKWADAVGKLPPGIDRTRAAMEMLTRHAALPLMPLINKGSAGIAAGKATAAAMGGAMSDEDIAKVAAAGLAFRNIDKSVEALWERLTIELAPGLEKIAGLFPDLMSLAGPALHGIGDGFGALADVAVAAKDALGPPLKDAIDYVKALGLEFPNARGFALGATEAIALGFAGVGDAARMAGDVFVNDFASPVLHNLSAILGVQGDLLNALAMLPGNGALKDVAGQLHDAAGAADRLAKGADAIGDHFKGGSMTGGVRDFFAKLFAGGGGTGGADKDAGVGGFDVKLAGAIETYNAALEKETNALGLSKDAIELQKLAQMGANEQMLAGTQLLMEQRDQVEAVTKAYASGTGIVEKFAAIRAAREEAGLGNVGLDKDLDRELRQRAEAMKVGNRSGLDKFQGQLDDLNEMRGRGLLGDEDFGAALGKLTKDQAGGLGLGGEVKLAGASEAGSSQAQSILAKAGASQGNDPAALLQQILRALQEDAARRSQENRAIEKAVRDGKINVKPTW